MRKKTVFNSLLLLLFFFASTVAFGEENGEHTAHSLNVLKEIVYPYINFVILLSLFIYLLRNPAKEFFLTRSKNIAQFIEQSAHEKQQAEILFQKNQSRLNGIEKEISSLTETLKKEGELTKEKIIEEAKVSSQRTEEITKWIGDQEFKKSREKLKEEMITLASQAAEKMIREKLNPDDQEKRIKNSLNRLESFS